MLPDLPRHKKQQSQAPTAIYRAAPPLLPGSDRWGPPNWWATIKASALKLLPLGICLRERKVNECRDLAHWAPVSVEWCVVTSDSCHYQLCLGSQGSPLEACLSATPEISQRGQRRLLLAAPRLSCPLQTFHNWSILEKPSACRVLRIPLRHLECCLV